MRLSTLLVLVCVAVLMTGASAQRSLECQKVWDGPSSNNDLVDCLKNSDRISSQWQYYIFPAVLLVIFLLTLILLPICVCCSCCQCCLCCLCCCKVPRTKLELSKGSCWLWMLVIWEALMSIAVFVMVVYGASLLMQSVDHSLDGVESGPLTYFNQTRDNILALLVDYSTNPPTPADVDVSAFDDVTKEMHQHVEDIRSDVWKYFKIGRGVSYGIGCLGFVLTLVLFVFLCCRASGCLTIVMSYVYYVLAFLYALCGVVFALAVYFVSAFCGEVTLQYTTEPGVFQWLVVPWCKEQFDFESLRTDVLNDEKTASEAACESVLEICDNTETYNNDDKMFMCGQGITSKAQCTNFAFVAQVVETTYAKPMLNNMLCTNTAGWEYQEKCTVLECSTRCQDYSTLKPKSLSQTAILGAQYAQNASTALSYVLPMMQCDFIVNKVISAVETSSQTNSAYSYHWPSQSNCSNLRLSSILLAVGFLVGSITFVLGVHILLRARSLWTHPVPEEPKDLRLANSPVQ